MSDKKQPEVHRGLIVILIVLMAVLLFPWNFKFVTDGGTREYESLFGMYEIIKWHKLADRGKDINGTYYDNSSIRTRYLIGTTVRLFGHVVYDHKYYDKPAEESIKYEEEVKELISYYNSHRVDDVELRSIYVSESKSDMFHYVDLSFLEVKKIEVSDRIVKVIKGYLDENHDSFLYDYKLYISARHNELVEKTRIREVWKPYEAVYELSLPNKTITDLRLSPAMIPDTVPSGYDFEDVQKISFSYGSAREDKERILRSIFPNAEIESE